MKKRILYFFQLIIMITLFYFIVQKYQFTWNKLTFTFQQPVWLIFSLYLAIVFIPIMAAARWNIFLNFLGIRMPLLELIKINFESIFWGTFLPSSDGFAAIRMYKIERKFTEFPGKSGSTVIAEKLLGFFVLCSLALLFSFFLKSIPNIIIIRLIILLIMLILIILMLLIFNKTFYGFISNFLLKSKISTKISIFISNIHDSLVKLPKLSMLATALPLIIILQIFTFLNVYLLFKAMGFEISLVNHLVIVPIIQIISLIPLTLSGLGIREGAFVYFYGFLGVKPEIAFTVSILNFLILNGIPAVIGGIISIVSQLKKTRISA
jgi:glycosyltransferase 2 family protein